MPNRSANDAARGFRDRLAGAAQQLGDIQRGVANTSNALLGATRAASQLFFTLQSIRLTIASIAFQGLAKVVSFLGQARRDGLSLSQTMKRAAAEAKAYATNMAEASRHGRDGQQVTGGLARATNAASQAGGKLQGRFQGMSKLARGLPVAIAGVAVGAIAAAKTFGDWVRELGEVEQRLVNIGRLSQQASADIGGDGARPGSTQRRIRSLLSSDALGRLSEEQAGQLIGTLAASAPTASADQIAGATTALATADIAGFDPQALAGDTAAGLQLGLSGADSAELAARARTSGAGGLVASTVSSARRTASAQTLQQLGPILQSAAAQGPAAIEAVRGGLSDFIARGERGDLRAFLGTAAARLPGGQGDALRATLDQVGAPGSVINQRLNNALSDPETRQLLAIQTTAATAEREQTARLRESALEEAEQDAFDNLARQRSGFLRFFNNIPLIGGLASADVQGELPFGGVPFLGTSQSDVEQATSAQLARSLADQTRVLEEIRRNTERNRVDLRGQTE